jgi:hypothetical protein
MQFAHAGAMDWLGGEEQHRGGGLAVKHLLAGEEGSLDNYRLVMGRDNGGHESPRHRHNFDQVRMTLQGTLSLAPGKDLHEGQVGYFPEGTPYGPQKDPLAERIALVLQCGGASGSGYISTRQMKEATHALAAEGEFKGGIYYRRDGAGRKQQDAYEAVWERCNGRKLDYPPQRYVEPILMTPASFAWVPDKAAPGVERKLLGVFTERGTRLEMIRIRPDAAATLAAGDGRILTFALSGAGICGAERWSRHSAAEIAPGETARFAADEAAEFLVITLPRIVASSAALT